MNTHEPSDAELLDAFRRHKCERSFAGLVHRYGSLVLGVAFRVLGNLADAEDAAQATFIALALKSSKVDARNGLGGWLHTVAVRAAVDLKKGNERRTRRQEGFVPSETSPAESLQEEIDDAIRKLPTKLRRALVQYYLEGRGVEEIARMEDCSPSAISMRLTRGRERLRARFGEAGIRILVGGLTTAVFVAEGSAAFVEATTATVSRALQGVRMAEPALTRLLEAARHAMRPSLLELWRPGLAGLTVAVALAGVATPIIAAQHSATKEVIAAKPIPMENVSEIMPIQIGAEEHPLIAAVKKNYGWTEMNGFTAVYDQYKRQVNQIRDAGGRTALHWAIQKGYEEFAALMVINGADVNIPDGQGYTPLFYAVNRRQIWTQLLLILKGADVNRVAFDGSTALSHAVKIKDVKTAEILLWTGAKISPPKAAPEWQPLALAGAGNNGEMLALLEDYSHSNAPSFSEPSGQLPGFVRDPLHEAARRGDFPMLESLLTKGWDANARNEKGRTPIFEAISAGHAEVVFYLLVIGADPNATDLEGRTPLNSTMYWLGGGLDANRRFLLSKGANPQAVRNDGYTELTWAVMRDNEHGVQWLLWKGVNPGQKTAHGTPFEIAVQEGNQRLIDLFRRNGIDGPIRLSNEPKWLLQNGAKRGDLATIDEALAAGAEIDQADEKGNTPFMSAIYKRNVSAARHLLKSGADLNYVNPANGRTPLYATVVWDYSEMTEFRKDLLESGADPNIASSSGETPLMRAVWHQPTTPLKQLIEYGADLNARDKQGRTALKKAIDEGKLETADYLRSVGATE